jgi:hypothetical protein
MDIIRKMKSGLGVAWAAACLVLILVTFVGLDFWSKTFARGTGIRISPYFSGGEVRQTIDHGSYKALLHRMVFDGLAGERSKGFVQIDWIPLEKQSLPAVLEEDLDIDGDGSNECSIRVDTVRGKTELLRQVDWVLGPEPLITADSERTLRVRLRNPRR